MKTEFSFRSRIVTSPFHELESLRVGELKYINKLRASCFQLPAPSFLTINQCVGSLVAVSLHH